MRFCNIFTLLHAASVAQGHPEIIESIELIVAARETAKIRNVNSLSRDVSKGKLDKLFTVSKLGYLMLHTVLFIEAVIGCVLQL